MASRSSALRKSTLAPLHVDDRAKRAFKRATAAEIETRPASGGATDDLPIKNRNRCALQAGQVGDVIVKAPKRAREAVNAAPRRSAPVRLSGEHADAEIARDFAVRARPRRAWRRSPIRESRRYIRKYRLASEGARCPSRAENGCSGTPTRHTRTRLTPRAWRERMASTSTLVLFLVDRMTDHPDVWTERSPSDGLFENTREARERILMETTSASIGSDTRRRHSASV